MSTKKTQILKAYIKEALISLEMDVSIGKLPSINDIAEARENLLSANQMIDFGACEIPNKTSKEALKEIHDGKFFLILNGVEFQVSRFQFDYECDSLPIIQLTASPRL